MLNKLTQSELKSQLYYDTNSGIFIRKSGCNAGGIAGSINSNGHRQIRVNGVLYLAHRLAWLYVHGKLPDYEIDHINGIRDDNKILNLREAAKGENNQNIKKYKNNTSGFTGVSYCKRHKKYIAHISVNHKMKYLGSFCNAVDAHNVYLKHKKELHKFNPIPRPCK